MTEADAINSAINATSMQIDAMYPDCGRLTDATYREVGPFNVTGFQMLPANNGAVYYTGGMIEATGEQELRLPQRRPWLYNTVYNSGCSPSKCQDVSAMMDEPCGATGGACGCEGGCGSGCRCGCKGGRSGSAIFGVIAARESFFPLAIKK